MIVATTKVKGFKQRLKYKRFEGVEMNVSTFLKQMSALEKSCQEDDSQVEVAIVLKDTNKPKDDFLYRTEAFVVGKGNGRLVINTIEKELLALFPDKEVEVGKLINQLIDEATNKVSVEEESEQVHLKSDHVLKKKSVASVESSPVTQKNVETEELKEIKNGQKKKNLSKKKVLGSLSIAVVIGVGIIAGFMYVPILLKPQYDTLIQNQEYVKAVAEYPEKKDKVESLLFEKGKEGVGQLEEYVAKTNSSSSRYDLAYLKQDFQKVVDMKEEATTPIRKTALAVSYVKLGMIDEAYELNQKLGSNRLKQLIVEAYEVKAIEALKALDLKTAERIQDKIHQLTLQTKIEHVTTALNEENNLKNKLKDSSLSDEQKEDSNKQLKQIQEKIEKIKKGVF
ncbi:hypothetical protein [uncultured Granulicatella sp.]|uniref:hypothetical protein n=1 Tax=uncultured Granulicatella sp. TaxID=316089 RepID=UPI00260E79C1|nr:hypothetical protein [uncultured Granulicatella sp.]